MQQNPKTRHTPSQLTKHHKPFYGSYDYFRGRRADADKCAVEVESGNGFRHQCAENRGYGEDKAFCREHARRKK